MHDPTMYVYVLVYMRTEMGGCSSGPLGQLHRVVVGPEGKDRRNYCP